MTRNAQACMFQYEDLPLFTGQAPIAFQPTVTPTDTSIRQESVFTCRICCDTGIAIMARPSSKIIYCSCQSGNRASQERRIHNRS